MYKEYASKQFVEEYFKNNAGEVAQQSDWLENDENSMAHVLNRPGGYVENNYKTVITSTGVVLENYSLTFEDGYGQDLESFGIVPGMFEEEQYLVIWDGKKYICSSFEAGVAVHIGHNECAVDGEPGFDYMPFLITSGYGSSDIKAFSSFQTEETGITTHTFSLYKIEETPVKFDKKYLPENIVYFSDDEENGTDVPDGDEEPSVQNGASQVIIARPVINEDTWDIERIEVTNKTSEELVALWNDLMSCNENVNPPILLYKEPTGETTVMNLSSVDDGDAMNIHFDSILSCHGMGREAWIDAECPNSIRISTYDIMPCYDSEKDEGNILRIVNGYAQWTSLPNAEEASF